MNANINKDDLYNQRIYSSFSNLVHIFVCKELRTI